MEILSELQSLSLELHRPSRRRQPALIGSLVLSVAMVSLMLSLAWLRVSWLLPAAQAALGAGRCVMPVICTMRAWLNPKLMALLLALFPIWVPL